jgi:DNA-binding NtrC family response regulator
VRRLVGLGLQAGGFVVWLAADAAAAVELYSRHRDAIDMVLLDVRMPGRDGPQTLAAIQKIDPWVRCCFMTGDPGWFTEEALVTLGAITVFWKPLHLRELAQHLGRLVAQPDREDASRNGSG